MVGFAKFVSIVILVLCGVALIGGIGFMSDSHGDMQGLFFVSTIVSVAVLAGLSTIVWNVASIAERQGKPAEDEARVQDANAAYLKL